MTIGFAGSNHALATAIYARQVGLASTSLLLPQLNGHYVRRNLLTGFACGARLQHYRTPTMLGGGILACMLRGWLRQRTVPTLIPAGGSCPLGVAGYVNAAIELRDQIAAGGLPPPDRVYVPLGSMGTSVGLALGLQAAGLKTQVIAVRVIEERLVSPRKAKALHDATCKLLRLHDPTFPRIAFSTEVLTIRNEFMGDRYARFTEAGARATDLLQDKAGIPLNGAYSAKALAALLADAQCGDLKGKTVLFWNTYNSRDLTRFTEGVDYHQLPPAFHRYFEEDVQELDRPAIRY
jgi:D-cysteine desulfhydrase